MTQKITKRIYIGGIILFIILLPPVIATVQSIPPQTPLSPSLFIVTQQPDMLIIISPQYANDQEIQQALTRYQQAVKNDLGWESILLPIDTPTNNWETIDHLIESYYTQHLLKACIMVGEDLQTPLAGDSNYMEKPSTMPWATIGESTAYENSEYGLVCTPYSMAICISLLYPTHDMSYSVKKAQLITTLQKFCIRQNSLNTNEIRVFESSDLNSNSKNLYQHLTTFGNLQYTENPSADELQASFSNPTSLYFVHGHSNPAGTQLNSQEKTGWFSAEYVDQLQTQLFAADGCYVNGWWSNQPDNNHLDSSIDATWYGSKIFTSTTIQVMVLGLLSQSGYSYPVSFLENAVPELVQGKTLAESMIGDTYVDSIVIFGDPTFHFSITT